MTTDLPVPALAGPAEPADVSPFASPCKWRASGGFAMVHQSGWTIGRYAVCGEWRHLLWEPIDRCTAASSSPLHGPFGPFDTVRDAMGLHRDLTSPAAIEATTY